MMIRALMGLALLLAGDREGYDQACQEYLSQSGNTDGAQGLGGRPAGGPGWGLGFARRPTPALQIPLLIPRSKEFCDALEDRFQFGEVANNFLSRIGAEPLSFDGWIAYRRGQFAQTLELLGDENERTSSLNLLLMAMASKQLGESDEATGRLSRAKEKIASREVEPEPSTTRSAFLDNLRGTNVAGQTWVIAAIEEVLLREAEQLIEGEVTASEAETKP